MTNIKKTEFLLNSLKILKPKLYKKMIHTGRLFEFLIEKQQLDEKVVKDYISASYLCNIGFLSLEESLLKEHTRVERTNIMKRHVKVSKNYLSRTGFSQLSKIVESHHEYPNGLGYFKAQQSDKLIGYINIADEFIDLTIEYFTCDQVLTLDEAIEEISKRYKNNSLYKNPEMTKIRKDLSEYYERFIINV
ncbi:MAG: hypothetical protein CL624_09350 [Arcobacter sp.]|nr:hypothetical protein [Arcobacter sp.]|tara:strand:- start:8750 stop:9322 length:573 start_codon:yes stop_codon:yes gene_type:complete